MTLLSLVKEDYINIQDALNRLGGNTALYKTLLERFVSENLITKIDEALNSGDMREVSHAAHTVKGVAANLSLTKLRDISAQLEQGVAGGSDISATLDEFRVIYDATNQVISETISGL